MLVRVVESRPPEAQLLDLAGDLEPALGRLWVVLVCAQFQEVLGRFGHDVVAKLGSREHKYIPEDRIITAPHTNRRIKLQ